MLKLKTEKTLIEVYPEWLTNGIFKQLETFDVPWKDYVDGSIIDLDYYGNRSGSKIISSLIENLLVDDVLSVSRQEQIATLIFKKYGVAWKKAWDAINTEYSPLYNYKMLKTETEDKTLKIDGTKDVLQTIEETGTNNIKNTGTVGTVENGTLSHSGSNDYDSETDNSIFGFNSSDPSNSDKTNTNQTNTTTSNDTSDKTSTMTDNRDELTTRDLNTVDDTNYIEDRTHKTDGVLTTETEGNIGVTTSQEMLESELKLRFDWSIFDLIYKDIDNVLTINIFSTKDFSV